jgi:phage-related baseplate assembly protein
MSEIEPIFIERDTEQVLAELIASYESLAGRPLQPAQPERLLLNAFAYRETLIRQAIQDTAVQNLVRFSSAPVLDYLGEIVGVKRLAPAPASCTIEFTSAIGNPGGSIPAGTRVASTDGKVVFATKTAIPVPGTIGTSFSVSAEALVGGLGGNGYVPGTIVNVLDPSPLIESAVNTDTTSFGTDEEDDEGLRERIQLAPASFSNAGSRGAYIFHTRTAHPSIIDVAVTSPTPGTVNIYPLVEGGITTPTPVINSVAAALNDEKIRPLTDTVVVLSPTAVNYAIVVNLVVLTSADSGDVQDAVEAALTNFATNKRLKLGRDVMASQIIAECMIDGVYTATLSGWSDKIIGATEFPKNTSITVTVTGTNVG